MINSILRFVFRVDKYENRLLDGIKASEEVTVETEYYDSYCDHKVIWEDIYYVYHLAKDGSEASIKRLQKEYKMKDNYSVDVTLRTPIFAERPNNEYYHTFSLEEVMRFYADVLENKAKQLEREKEKAEKEIEMKRKNETKNLAETVNKIVNKL